LLNFYFVIVLDGRDGDTKGLSVLIDQGHANHLRFILFGTVFFVKERK